MRMPIEIRLIIYELLLDDRGHTTLEFVTEAPESYKTRPAHKRTKYLVLGPGIQRRACETTYRVLTDCELHTNILAVSRQINDEASYLLYGRHSFDFGLHTEAIVPFLSDLTPHSRALVQCIHITKQARVYSRDFDRCEWSNVCQYLAQRMMLRKLSLRIRGGRPLRDWTPTSYSAEEFRTLSRVGYEGIDWVEELVAVRNLKELEISSDVQLCPPPCKYKAFSCTTI